MLDQIYENLVMGGDQEQMTNPAYDAIPQQRDPISSGALTAMKTARRSIGMNEQDRRNAMGMAIMRFFGNMARPGYGSTLGAMANSVNPAMEAYLSERNIAEAKNAALLKDAMAQEGALRREAAHNRQISESERHNKAVEQLHRDANNRRYGESQAETQFLKEEDKSIKDNTGDHVTSISLIPYNRQLDFSKNLRAGAEKYNAAVSIEDKKNRLFQLVNKYPQLFGNFKTIAHFAQGSHDESYFKKALQNFGLTEEEQDAAYEIGSLTKNLYKESLHGISPKGLNMNLENVLKQATAGMHMTPNGFKKVLMIGDRELNHDIQELKKQVEYGRVGKEYIPKPIEKISYDNYKSEDGNFYLAGPKGNIALGKSTPKEVIDRFLKEGYRLVE